MLAVSPVSVTLCAVTSAEELTTDAVDVVTGVEVLYHTLVVEGSFVVHIIVAVLEVVLVAEIKERIGATISGVDVGVGGVDVAGSFFKIPGGNV